MSTGCQKDRNIERQTDRQTDRPTDRRQNDFSAQLSKQKLLRKSTGCQKDRKTDRQTDRQKDRKTFQLSYQNKSCQECQQDVRKIERQAN